MADAQDTPNVVGSPPTRIHVARMGSQAVARQVIDRGGEAVYEVVHDFVGDHPKGSRLVAADFRDSADLARLVKLGAVAPLEKPATD